MVKRKAKINSIKLLSYNYPEARIVANVSAGTYIRSIAFDMWEYLWTWAYVSYLRRTKIWKIYLKNANHLSWTHDFIALNEIELFWKDRFIELDEKNLSRLNDWLERRLKMDLEAWDYFIEKAWDITNIVNYENGILKPLKKVL